MGLGYETEHPFDDEPDAKPMTSPAIKLARECGWFKLVAEFPAHTVNYVPVTDDQLERFYAKAQAQALRDAAKKFRGEIGYNFVAADGYSNAFDVASELEYMADELEAGK